jgi:hypothetical protein
LCFFNYISLTYQKKKIKKKICEPNLEKVSDIAYFEERVESLLHGANFGFSLKFGETFKIKSLMGML